MGTIFTKSRIDITSDEIHNDEEVAFSKTTPSHLVLGEVSNPHRTQVLGRFVRVMHEPAGNDFYSKFIRCH